MPAASLRKMLKEKLHQLISESSFHGFPKILSSDFLIQKLLWTLFTVAMYGYLSFSIYGSVIDYFNYSVVTSINTIYESEAKFPAVKYCGFRNRRENRCNFNGQPCPINSSRPRDFGFYKCELFNDGFDENFYPKNILATRVFGASYGLRLELIPDFNTQIDIQIYNQSTDFDNLKTIKISQGMEYNLVINKVITKKLSFPFSDCITKYSFAPDKLDINPNQTDYPYFQRECHILCKMQKEMEACNRSELFDLNSRYYFTNKTQFWFNFFFREHYDCSKSKNSLLNSIERDFAVIGPNQLCDKICPIECDSISYVITPYSNFIGNRVSKINIYYEGSIYTAITEEPKQNFDNLLGTVGGLLGLFLGASLMSFFEIFDLIFSLILITIKHSNKGLLRFDPKIRPG